MKIVVAKNSSIASAGDVNIYNIIVSVGAHTSAREIAGELLETLRSGSQASVLESLEVGGAKSVDEKVKEVIMLSNTSAFGVGVGYDEYFSGLQNLQDLLTEGVNALRRLDYLGAHRRFKAALSRATDPRIRRLISYDYFATGYIGYSLTGDLDELGALIGTMRSGIDATSDRRLDIIVAEAHQEMGTRLLSDDILIENETLLKSLAEKFGTSDAYVLNLRGLLSRRLGERPGPQERREARLNEACGFFRAIETLEIGTPKAEVLNNWAVTLLRLFEVTGDLRYLDMSEEKVHSIDYDTENIALADYLAMPKALNNLGNIGKQRLKTSGAISHYDQAMDSYSGTSRFWNEDVASYEWAMVQKNKAETRYEYMQLYGFDRVMYQAAIEEISAALRHRTATDAPYQNKRTLEVLDKLQRLPNDT